MAFRIVWKQCQIFIIPTNCRVFRGGNYNKLKLNVWIHLYYLYLVQQTLAAGPNSTQRQLHVTNSKKGELRNTNRVYIMTTSETLVSFTILSIVFYCDFLLYSKLLPR